MALWIREAEDVFLALHLCRTSSAYPGPACLLTGGLGPRFWLTSSLVVTACPLPLPCLYCTAPPEKPISDHRKKRDPGKSLE